MAGLAVLEIQDIARESVGKRHCRAVNGCSSLCLAYAHIRVELQRTTAGEIRDGPTDGYADPPEPAPVTELILVIEPGTGDVLVVF